MKKIITIMLVSLALLSCNKQINSPKTNSAKPVEIAMTELLEGIRTIDVTIGDKTWPFIFDTGGGITLITPDVAEEIGCDTFGRFCGYKMTGHIYLVPRCGPQNFNIGGVEITDETGYFDLISLIPPAVPKEYRDKFKKLGGIISLTAFRNTPFSLDLSGNRLILETPGSLKRKTGNMTPISIRTGKQAGGAALDLFIKVAATPEPLWFEFDTGSTRPLIISPHSFLQQGQPVPEINFQDGLTINEIPVTINGMEAVNMRAEPKNLIYDGNLGIPFIEKFTFTIDLKNNQMWGAIKL